MKLPLQSAAGGGTLPPVEARVSRLESDMAEIKSDLKAMRADIAYLKGRFEGFEGQLKGFEGHLRSLPGSSSSSSRSSPRPACCVISGIEPASPVAPMPRRAGAASIKK
ncbi:hypothetical protein [Methylocella sp.]|uniref:hypothetical protein n=1 Tax=Methylocella sp. TaxID=1978226 RepID=UPI0035B29471